MVPRVTAIPPPGVSAALSLLSLAWSNASYAKWMRRSRGDKLPLSGAAAVVQVGSESPPRRSDGFVVTVISVIIRVQSSYVRL